MRSGRGWRRQGVGARERPFLRPPRSAIHRLRNFPGDRLPSRDLASQCLRGSLPRLAGALALSEVLMSHAGADLDFRVLDEPTRGMGGSGVDDLCDLLANYARDAGLRILFIDHLARESAAFARIAFGFNEAGRFLNRSG